MSTQTKTWLIIIIFLSLLGILDASYLTYEHFQDTFPPCKLPHFLFLAKFNDCGQVLNSPYAQIGPIPTAALGIAFYTTVMIITLLTLYNSTKYFNLTKTILLLLGISGIITSAILVYLQLFVIHAICPYCMLSAFTTLAIFLTVIIIHRLPTESH